jgi:hypothetical protein
LHGELAEDAVLELVQSTNQLFRQLWRVEELPPEVIAIHQADFYVAQVRNGGHSQFFYNARDLDRVVALAREGLSLVGAAAELDILERALALSRRSPSLLERLRRALYWGAASEIAPSFGPLDNEMRTLAAGSSRWSTKCANWLRSSDVIVVVDDERAHRAALDDLARIVPDRDARVRARDAAREAAMSPVERTVREACRARGLEYRGLRVGRPLEDGSTRWSIATDPTGNHRAVTRGDVLVRIDWDVPLTEREKALHAKLAELLREREPEQD